MQIQPIENTAQNSNKIDTFTFGDPVPVLEKNEIFDYLECCAIGNWYETPLSLSGLAKTFGAAPHHSSAIFVKRNILASTFIPHKFLSHHDFSQFALDFLVFGNAYLELRKNRLGQPLKLRASLAKHTRRGIDGETYYFLQNGGEHEHKFEPGSVFHLFTPDINQELYGVPEYLAAIPAVLLNELSTLFRIKYYKNSGHAGYILYMSDAAHNSADVNKMREALKDTRGRGNFRNLFMYSPNGKKDGVQVIPLGEVSSRDEFFNIKRVSRDDILAAHRVPPQMMGILPDTNGGFGDVEKASKVFVRNELEPLQAQMRQVNDWLGSEVIRFKEYSLDA